MDSILNSVKKMLGIEETYVHFDPDIILHINSVFMILTQLGVGPKEGFSISDSSATWNDFIGDDTRLEAIKTYTFQKVRMIFDPPSSSALSDALLRSINELEWRLNVNAENKN